MKFITTYTTRSYFPWKNKCKYIMLHHTWWGGDEQQARYLANSDAVSCHYVVWQEWGIYQLATDDKCTWHAGKGSYQWIINKMNYYAIWIEIVSKTGEDYTDIQRTAVRKLVEYLLKKHNLSIDSIIRHLDYTSRKLDVWDKFRNPYFKSREDYRNSYKTKEIEKLTIEEQEYFDMVLEWNWKMYHKTKNKDVQDLVHSVSNQIRAFIEKHK